MDHGNFFVFVKHKILLVTIYSLRSDLVVATVYLRKPPPSISDRTRGPRACSLLRLAAAVRSVLFSGSPLRCRRALPPPPTFYSVAALSSPTFGGLAALLSSFPRRTSKKLGPLSSSRRRIPSMRGRRRQIQTTTNTTPAATFPQAAAMASSASLQSFLPPSAHAATSSSQHRPNRARPFQCAAVSAPSYSAASPSASAVPAERVEQRCNGRAGTGCSRRSTAPASQAHQAAHGADADKLTKEDVDVRLGLFHRRKQQCMPLLCQGIV